MRIRMIVFAALIISIASACEKEEKIDSLTLTASKIEFEAEGGSKNFILETNASSWNIENRAAGWVSLSKTEGTLQKAKIIAEVESRTLTPRKDTLVIYAGNSNPAYIVVSQESSEYLHNLSSNRVNAMFNRTASSVLMEVTSDAPLWTLSCDAEWINLSQNEGSEGTTTVTINVTTNSEAFERTDTILLSAEYAPTSLILITQIGSRYPNYNSLPIEPDATGMGSRASELANKMKLGWNIGNTLEAMGGETAWGNPMITKELIQLVKNNGFNAIRIPCSYHQHMEDISTAKIKESWLDRVKEVVQYCIDEDLYVLLNIHWDGGWLENNCTPDRKDANNDMQRAFWQQIATHMRDFDEHLMFASANEPNVDNATQMAVLNSYHQTFIDAVRETGGRNAYRILVVQGPGTDMEKTNKLMSTLPTDEIANRMMVEVHYYTPWNFCGLTTDVNWGNMFYYWGDGYHSETDVTRNATWGEEAVCNDLFRKMKEQFIMKGIPVILGEYGVIRRSDLTGNALEQHLDSRAYYNYYITKKAKENNLIPFYWDEGYTGNNGFAIFNRADNTVFDQQVLDSLVKAVN